MIPHLIGISGKAGAGKDTLGLLLQDRLQGPVAIQKFATNLKRVAGIILNVDPRCFEDSIFKKEQLPDELQQKLSLQTRDENGKPMWTDATTSHDYRWFLQHLGTEVGRSLHYNLWVWSFFQNYDPEVTTIITDVRFKNEADEIKRRGGIMIRVENSRLPKPSYLFSTPHASEVELDHYRFDEVVHNDEGLGALADKAAGLLNSWSVSLAQSA